MAVWQHAHLTVSYGGEHTEESGRFFKRSYQVQDWFVHWFGPEGEHRERRTGRTGTPVQVLNELGSEGWEVVTAFLGENEFAYVLKRNISDLHETAGP